MSSEETLIYVLKDPDTNEIRYVGKTINLRKRYNIHTSKKTQEKIKTYVSYWLLTLLNNNKKPILEIIERCTKKDWVEREIYWIDYYKNLIPNLCNISKGGEGGNGNTWTEAQKLKQSEILKGRKLTEEHKRNISINNKAKIFCGKKLINIKTKEVFNTVREASERLNMKANTLSMQLTGKNTNKTNLRYL
jgi:predicted GIY-YIG superfamily endonuclease